MTMRFRSLCLLGASLALGCGASSAPSVQPDAVVGNCSIGEPYPGEREPEPELDAFPLPVNLAPSRWFVLGPFAHPGTEREAGLDHDYLTPIGGEGAARLGPSTTLDLDGRRLVAAELPASEDGLMDLKAFYEDDTDGKLAYAYGELDWPREERLRVAFGSDDSAAVWLNGQRVHRVFNASRGLNPDSDHFELPLRKGSNQVLIKVENGTGGWGFALTVHDAEGQERERQLAIRRQLEKLELGPESGSYLLGDELPRLVYARSEDARLVFGDTAPSVRWFDPDLREVQAPAAPGRYLAVVEHRSRDYYLHRSMLTFAKLPPGPPVVSQVPTPPFADPPLLPSEQFPGLNAAQKNELSRHMWRAFSEYMGRGEDAAIARLGVAELASHAPDPQEPAWLSSGFIRNAEQQLRLRMQLEQRTPRRLEPPVVISPKAPELRVGSERDAGVLPGTQARLRGVAADWLKQDPNGFVVLVARRGVVFMHEGFGGFGKDQTFRPASIGKLIAGLTFARAVDQGLVGFDDPVSSVLGEWRMGNAAGISFRSCFNHIAGLPGHASHRGLFNPYLDNALLMQDSVFTPPLRRHHYNGDGYNLTGRALELITGQSIWRLLYENVQKPFGEPVTQFDLGFGDRFSARYLGEVGQMLLQDGSYGGHRFFSPGFLPRLLPEKVAAHTPGFPDEKLEWGIGQTWTPDPSSGPREQGALGPDVFGHGAASGSVFRVDRAHQLVVVIGRDGFKTRGDNERLAAEFMRALAQGLDEASPASPRSTPAPPKAGEPLVSKRSEP